MEINMKDGLIYKTSTPLFYCGILKDKKVREIVCKAWMNPEYGNKFLKNFQEQMLRHIGDTAIELQKLKSIDDVYIHDAMRKIGFYLEEMIDTYNSFGNCWEEKCEITPEQLFQMQKATCDRLNAEAVVEIQNGEIIVQKGY